MPFAFLDSFAQTLHERVSSHPSAIIVAIFISAMLLSVYKRPDLSHIPTAGSTGLLSYYDGFRYVLNAKDVLHEGYSKFRREAPGIFKVATLGGWNIMVASPEMINELILAKSNEVSVDHSVEEEFATRYTVGLDSTSKMYHIDAVRTTMTRSLATKFDEIHDEVVQSFEDLIPAKDEWLAISGLSTVQKIVCRTSNRLFLGEPICRNAEWIDLNIKFTVDVFLRAMVINLFPSLLKPFVGTLLSPLNHAMRTCRKYLKAEVEQRLERDAEYGKNDDSRLNDLISWMLEHAPKEEHSVDDFLKRILTVNMTAIHTTSNIFFEALLNLAAHPEYAAPMREEVVNVIEEYGWTKAALNKMRKVDSFFKETARCEGMGAVTVKRKIIKQSGYTFANGVHLPYGSDVGVPTFAIHHNAEYYDDPFTFEGFRFSKIREDDGESLKHQMVSTDLHYMNFGHRRHACPGRFFAATELKAMMAYLLVTYEVKLDSKPKSIWFGPNFAPDDKAKVLFRRLQKENY